MTKNLTDELQVTARQALAGLHPTPIGEEQGGLSFRKLIAAAFRGRYLVFATTLFGILVGTFLAITTTNRYQSTGTFQFTATGAERESLDPTGSAQTSQETIATSASYILNTDDLLKRVVTRLTPGRILQPYQPGGGPEDTGAKALFFRIQRSWNETREEDRTAEAALKYLKKTVFVERPRYTDVLIATCNANNAELAQEILATYMDEARKLHIEKYDDARAYEEAQKAFTDAQVQQTTARNGLREFLERKAQVDDFDAEKRRLQLAAAEGAVALRKLQDDIVVKQNGVAELKKKLEGPEAIQPYSIQKVKPGLNAENSAALNLRIVNLQVEIARLQTQLVDPNDREIAEKRAELTATKKALDDMRKESLEAEPVNQEVPNPLYAALIAEKAQYEGELITDSSMQQLATQQQDKRAHALRDLLSLEPEYERLRTARVLADGDVEATRINWEAARRKRMLGQGNFSTLKEIEPATLPLDKEGPNRGKLLLGGFFVGLFLGLGIVVLRALPDTVVRTRDDLESIDGLAVIGVMPRLDGGNLRRHVALREQGW